MSADSRVILESARIVKEVHERLLANNECYLELARLATTKRQWLVPRVLCVSPLVSSEILGILPIAPAGVCINFHVISPIHFVDAEFREESANSPSVFKLLFH